MSAQQTLYDVDANVRSFPVAAGVAIASGVFVGLNAANTSLFEASDNASEGNEVQSRKDFVKFFAGISEDLTDGTQTVAKSDFSVAIAKERRVTCVSSTYKVGDLVGPDWNSTTSKLKDDAVKKVDSLDEAIGIVIEPAVSAVTEIRVAFFSRLNPRALPLVAEGANGEMVFSYEFDCEGGGTGDHEIIPASANRGGLLITRVFGRITEAFAGVTQDQGIVTVKDEDDNAITTVTVADTSGDAVGDVRLGYLLSAATAGDATKTVASRKAVEGAVTQQTSGASAAGKMVVFVFAVPLIP